jgi:NTP pyrophosphatase (non-canonical NTP hydrolase)
MELIKKDQFHGKPYTTDLLVKELGDVLYYLTALCELHGTTLEHVAEVNNAKLRARYPEGFVTGGGNR